MSSKLVILYVTSLWRSSGRGEEISIGSAIPSHSMRYRILVLAFSQDYEQHSRMWDFKFSRRWVCSSESSGMYCHVLNWMLTNVSEVLAASIIRAISEPSAKGLLVI
jgi:hypothetical protein